MYEEFSETESLLLSEGESEPVSSVSVSQVNVIILLFVVFLVFHVVHNTVGRMSQIGGR